MSINKLHAYMTPKFWRTQQKFAKISDNRLQKYLAFGMIKKINQEYVEKK